MTPTVDVKIGSPSHARGNVECTAYWKLGPHDTVTITVGFNHTGNVATTKAQALGMAKLLARRFIEEGELSL
jgi:hypothetical protein